MRRLGIPALFVGLGVAVSVAVMPTPGESATAPAGPVVLTASPDESLVDGQVVTVFADADVSSELHAMRARLCRHDANIADAAAFVPGGTNCPSQAIGGGQVEAAINLPAGSLVAQLQYAVGTGTANWVSDQGRKQTLTCDAASPCDLVVQLEVPDATVYAALPLQFGAPASDPAATGAASPATDAAAARSQSPRASPRRPPRRPHGALAAARWPRRRRRPRRSPPTTCRAACGCSRAASRG